MITKASIRKLEKLSTNTPLRVTWRDASSDDSWVYMLDACPTVLLVVSVGMFHSTANDALLLMGSRGSSGQGSMWLTIPFAYITHWEVLHAA